ncbi:MAG: hypothetical protein ACKOTB_10910, partial [Planctomycetia bacterium]
TAEPGGPSPTSRPDASRDHAPTNATTTSHAATATPVAVVPAVAIDPEQDPGGRQSGGRRARRGVVAGGVGARCG